jgi:hypothetical protein
MSHQFSMVPRADIPRSSFDRTHGHKTTFDPGYLVPIYVDEALPGDTFNMKMTGFARLSTPLKPYMDNAYFNTFFFAVPNRLVWDNWQKFNGEQESPGDSTDYLVPQVVAPATNGWVVNEDLSDYFGLPCGVPNISVSALWHRAYNLIYNEWFRDENLDDPAPVNKGDGPDDNLDYIIRKRGKRHDYFTSCLPWPQKGESVSIPLGQFAPLAGDPANPFPTFQPGNTMGPGHSLNIYKDDSGGAGNFASYVRFDNSAYNTQADLYWDNPALVADLSNATSATINELRQAFQIQKLYERDARGGTRYTEIIRSHFGVVSPDARLQRPEYLGGGQSPINITQVPQTGGSGANVDTPQGNLAAFGTSLMHNHGFKKSFTEHCIIIGLVCVRADLTYQRGINRMFSRRGRFDFYWPALSHIGEQAVLSQELYCDGSSGDTEVFGYQERYAEYRYKPSMITGEFRSNFAQSLDYWHLSQDFASRPLLNGAFIQEDPPFDRVVAVPSEPKFIADFYFQLRCARPMPVYGVPGLIDHF